MEEPEQGGCDEYRHAERLPEGDTSEAFARTGTEMLSTGLESPWRAANGSLLGQFIDIQIRVVRRRSALELGIDSIRPWTQW